MPVIARFGFPDGCPSARVTQGTRPRAPVPPGALVPLQESPSADRRSAPRVAFAGPCSALDRALVQEAGGEIVSDISSADVVHVTLDPPMAADAVETLVADGHHIVLHTLADLTSSAATALARRAA